MGTKHLFTCFQAPYNKAGSVDIVQLVTLCPKGTLSNYFVVASTIFFPLLKNLGKVADAN